MKIIDFNGLIHACLLTTIGCMILLILPSIDPFDIERYKEPKRSKIRRRRKHGSIIIVILIAIEIFFQILK